MNKWNTRFFELAKHVATWSKDPRTKVGAVVVDDLNRIIGVGYNGFPRGVVDTPALYQDRESKLQRVVHAETNAILNSNTSVRGCKIYVTLPPCNECAKIIIQSGIAEVHVEQSDRLDLVAVEMFEQSKVKFYVHESINSL